MNKKSFAEIAETAVNELIEESPYNELNDDDFADYAQIIMNDSDDPIIRALAFDENALTTIFDLMIAICDKRNIRH